MIVLITGASGFLGRETVKVFLNQGHQVYSLVRKKSDLPNEIICDLASVSFEELKGMIPQVDVIIHLAADTNFSKDLTKKQFRINTLSTQYLTMYCELTSTKLIFSSAIGIHGYATERITPITEIRPELPYMMSKWISEKFIRDIQPNSVILRIGGIYGLHGPKHLGLNTAIVNALEKHVPPTINGSGKSKRNYIYVKDLAKWILLLAESPDTGIFYACGKENLSIRELLTEVSVAFTGRQPYENSDAPEGRDMLCDISEIHPALTSFTDALADIKKDYELLTSDCVI